MSDKELISRVRTIGTERIRVSLIFKEAYEKFAISAIRLEPGADTGILTKRQNAWLPFKLTTPLDEATEAYARKAFEETIVELIERCMGLEILEWKLNLDADFGEPLLAFVPDERLAEAQIAAINALLDRYGIDESDGEERSSSPSPLNHPLSREEQIEIADENWIEAIIKVPFNEIIKATYEEFLDLIAETATGNNLLEDVEYKLIGSTPDGDALVKISGSIAYMFDESN